MGAIPPGAAEGSDGPLALAPGVELLGRFEGSGYREAPGLLRHDHRTLEVSPLLYTLCCALDGERRLVDLASFVSVGAGREVTPDDIRYLLEQKLAPLGLLSSCGDAGPPSAGRRRGPPVRKAIIAGAAVERVSEVLQVLFRPPMVAIVLVALVATDVTLLAAGDLGQSMGAVVDQPAQLLVVALLTLLSGAFHELGHAAACRYGGANPGGIGIGIYLVWPVFFNDIDDSYRLDRNGRLRADVGGIYFNAVFIVATGSGFLLSGYQPLFAVAAIQHLLVLQQFLPFVRLDGYYLVSDLAGVTNLFGLVSPTLGSLVPGRPTSPELSRLRTRARLMVTAWVLSTVGILGVLSVVLVLHLPEFAASVGQATQLQATSMLNALNDGALWMATTHLLGVGLALVPPVGILLTVGHAARVRLRRGT